MNTIPSSDVVLRRVVERVATETPVGSAADLAERLRPLYPRIAVFERQLSGERPHLYVYRDGRYEPERGNEWWERPGVPCVHVSARDGRITGVSATWTELMDAQAADVVGRPFAEFVKPEARGVAQAMFETVDEEREVGSEATVLRPNGTTLRIEFRAIRREGQIDVCYRPLES